MRTVAEAAADREVRKALIARKGKATVGDLVVATGIPEHQTRRSVERLLEAHEGAYAVAEGGALVYRFEVGALGLRKRKPFAAFWHTVATLTTAAVKALRAAFHAVLAVQLLFYMIVILAPISVVAGAVVGIVLMIVMVVAAISEGGDVSGLFELMFNPYVLALVAGGFALYGIYLAFSVKVQLLMAVVGKHESGQRGIAGFIGQVNDFALGPDRPPTRAERIDRRWTISQADEQIILARVRARGGKLRAGDLVAWLGLDLERAERQVARVAVEYGGEPTVTDAEIIEVEIPLVKQTAGGAAKQGETTHERALPLPQLTGNSWSEDLVIGTFAVASLVAGLVVGQWMEGKVEAGADHAFWWNVGSWAFGTIPVGFTVLLLGLLALRAPVVALRRAWILRQQRRRALHQAIVAHARARGPAPTDLDAMAARAGLSPAAARDLAVSLGGEFDLAGDAEKTVWKWRRLATELKGQALPPKAA